MNWKRNKMSWKRNKMSWKKKIATLCFGVLFIFVITGCNGDRPMDLGIKKGQLLACPSEKENCVSSQSTEEAFMIDSFRGKSGENAQQVFSKLKQVIQSMKRTKIVKEESDYLHAEFTTAIMRFVDDVELYVDSTNQVVHVRSASRLGQKDFGVNRKRVEEIRKRLGEM